MPTADGREGRVNLDQLRAALLDLHKAVLRAQQIRYEREHGRVASRGELLQLVVQHADFQWIRALSALIAQLDEWSEADGGMRGEELDAVVRALQTLVQRTAPTPSSRRATGRCSRWCPRPSSRT